MGEGEGGFGCDVLLEEYQNNLHTRKSGAEVKAG